MFLRKKKIYLFILIFCFFISVLIGGISYKIISTNESIKADAEMMLVNSGAGSENIQVQSTNNRVQEEDGYTDINYIENANYFLANPYHADSNQTYNETGTCTTIAMQLLLGYHNYYSDRRLIPTIGENDRVFLSDDYGDLRDHPNINTSLSDDNDGQGRSSIGTQPGVWEEILRLTAFSDVVGIGQAMPLVVGGSEAFINKYSPEIRGNISLDFHTFSNGTARKEIEAGRPIIVGFSELNVEDVKESNFHVMVAYGYATYNGDQGFLVHYGWGSNRFHTWVPIETLGFQITMSVDHTHTFRDNFLNVPNNDSTHRGLICDECGCETVDPLYDINEAGDTIIRCRYPLSGNIDIPFEITGKRITAIGEGVFVDSNVSSIDLGGNIKNIGNSAFENCTALETISGLNGVGIPNLHPLKNNGVF